MQGWRFPRAILLEKSLGATSSYSHSPPMNSEIWRSTPSEVFYYLDSSRYVAFCDARLSEVFMSERNIILFELNEVPYRIIQHYCAHDPNSTLSKILPKCRVYQTYAEDAVLSPWVTWPTLHRGVTDAKHGIHNFGQDLTEVGKEFPPLWDLLAQQGFTVGVFGSLHSYPLPKDLSNYAFFVPDAFAAGSECFPKQIEHFQDFNLAMSRASARNISKSLPWKQTLSFLASLPDLGIKTATIADVAHQVISERLDVSKSCRRRTYQVVLAFDIFMKQLQDTLPHFSTFFTNHVASSMHRYWAAAFPEDYSEFNHSQEWVSTYKNEILFTMGKFDRMLNRLVQFVSRNADYSLWVTTSMGQAATHAEPCESELVLSDIPKFMSCFDIQQWSARAAMVPQVGVVTEQADKFERGLATLRINGKPLNYTRVDDFFSLSFGHLNQKGKCAELNGQAISFSSLGLENIIIEDHTGSTAYHIPQGCLFIYESGGQTKSQPVQISTRDIFQAITGNYGFSNKIVL